MHTPGPWTLELVQKWPFGVRVSAGEKNIHVESAWVHSTHQNTREDCELAIGFKRSVQKAVQDAIAEQDANARLIAAAPDLLTACKWFIKQLEDGVIVRDITKDHQSDWANRMMHFTLDLQKAMQAIAKAEGRA